MPAMVTYPRDYIDACRARADAQMATYRRTAQADPDFESVFSNNMVLGHKVGAMIRLT